MPSDFVSITIIFLTTIYIILNKKLKIRFNFSTTYKLLFIYVILGIISSLLSPFEISFLNLLKEPYLFLSSLSACLIISINRYNSKILSLAVHSAFLIILFLSVLGYLLFYLGIENNLVSSSKIINVALPMFQDFKLPPRAVSLVKPTSNLLAIYLTLYLPLFILNFKINISKNYINNIFLRNSFLLAILMTPFISLLTYSRAFIPILLIIFFLPNPLPKQGKYLYKFFLSLISLLFAGLFIFIQFFTIFYTTNTKISMYDTIPDSAAKKEIVNLGKGKKLRPNPLYYDDQEEGKKKFEFSTNIHFNHYYWLKKSALSTKHSSIRTELFGFGPSNYSNYAESKYLVMDKNIKSGLSDFIGTQSQLFTSLITHGKMGVLIIFLLILNAIVKLKPNKNNINDFNLSQLKIYIFLSLILISLDCDISNIRFIWGLIPHIYFIEESFERIYKKDIDKNLLV